ncbi:FHA domain-containing protein [Streptomyces sp. NPDC088725]|uniref:FHA domain-containing protein n=1 Tax=Streptomyces sp. NPDC088725 TaxID=3365873 RepID=UPI0038165CC2
MPTCPNGHQSGSDDWCEVCGRRMAGPGAPANEVPGFPPPPPVPGYGYPPAPGQGRSPAAGAQPETCPQCRTPREPMAPYCEECRWNFLTNTATSYTPLAPQPGGAGGRPGTGRGDSAAGGSGPALNLPPGFQPQQSSEPPFQRQSPEPPFQQQSPEPPYQRQAPEPPFQRQAPGQQSARPPFPQQSAPPSFPQQSAPPAAPSQPQAPQGRQAEDDWQLRPPSLVPPQQAAPQQTPPQQYEPSPPANWTAVIGPDREYFMAMMQRSGPEATGLNLPAYAPEQRLPLVGKQLTIGRRRHSTGESPDVDLSVPPEDPGVSHQHAVLIHQPDGNWAVVDQNSTNGTTVNNAEDPIQPYVPVTLQDGDRVHVGAWTTITIRRG